MDSLPRTSDGVSRVHHLTVALIAFARVFGSMLLGLYAGRVYRNITLATTLLDRALAQSARDACPKYPPDLPLALRKAARLFRVGYGRPHQAMAGH